jgi:hypothetical protein
MIDSRPLQVPLRLPFCRSREPKGIPIDEICVLRHVGGARNAPLKQIHTLDGDRNLAVVAHLSTHRTEVVGSLSGRIWHVVPPSPLKTTRKSPP